MRLPPLAVILGVLGLVPFAGAGLLAVTGDPVVSPRAVLALIGYGAVILAFLGGVHWGFALDGAPVGLRAPDVTGTSVVPNTRVTQARLVLGVVPSLIGWSAILLAVFAWTEMALLLLIVGFIAAIVVEARAHARGLLPPGYIWLRWGLSIGVLICLVSVALLRVLGGNIIL